MSNNKQYRQYDSGAKRDNNSTKAFVHNLRGYTRLRFGYHMTHGAKKYGDGNWLLGMPTDQYLESLDRHLALYMEGDRSEDHLAAIIFGAQGCMINEQKEGISADKYFKQNNKVSDGNFQRPHDIDDMPLDVKYHYVEDGISKGELSILTQQYPNDNDLGACIRRISHTKSVKQESEILEKEMD
jgi:Domain of unknown function (DUF5664)